MIAAPISNGERLRFNQSLRHNVRELRNSEATELGVSYDPKDIQKILKRLKSLGWVKQVKSFVGYELLRSDFTWPIYMDLKQNLLYLGPDDGAGSVKDIVSDAAKAILPGGFGVFDSYAIYKTVKAEDSTVDQILRKAKKYGFRHQDGQWSCNDLVLQFNISLPSLTVYILFDAQRGI